MQDRYVGDVGDYAKYALLRALAGAAPTLRLGVLWYLFPDEVHNGDGRHVGYLSQAALAARDPGLHARLGRLVAGGRRSVAAVQRGRILPAGTRFHASLVAISAPPAERVRYREAWFAEALGSVAPCDLVFLDPDNGIETPALDRRAFRAGKYTFWSEIEGVWRAGKSLVVYNHLNRSAPAPVQTAVLHAKLRQRLGPLADITPLLFRRGSCRHMWVIAQPAHRSTVTDRIGAFLARGWDQDARRAQ